MAQATIGAGSAAVTVYTRATSFSVSGPLGQPKTCSFDVIDPLGSWHFYRGQPVQIVSALDGTNFFTGWIDTRKEVKYGYYPGRLHTLNCVDNVRLATKRVIGKAYTDIFAGDIVSDFVTQALAAEGVIGQHAIQADSNVVDFTTGTLVNTAAAPDGTDGHLQLATGTSVLRTEQTQTDWEAGVLTGGVSAATAGHLTLAAVPALKFTCSSSASSTNNGYAYIPIGGAVSQAIATGDQLVFDVFVLASSPNIRGGVDNENSSPTTNLRNTSAEDQNNYQAHPKTDISAWATGQWYHRVISLTPIATYNVTQWNLGFDGLNASGTITAYFKNIYVLNSVGAVKYTVFDATTGTETFGSVTNFGYTTGAAGSNVTAYAEGVRISPVLSLSALGVCASSSVSWVQDAAPTGTSLLIESSINNGAAWVTCTSGNPIPNLLEALSLGGSAEVVIRQTLSPGSDPTNGAPDITSLTVNITSANTAVKDDVSIYEGSTAELGAGTLTNTLAANNELTLNSHMVSWITGTSDAQTQWASGTSPSTVIQNGMCNLNVTGAGDIKSQLTNIPSTGDFILDVDLVCPAAAGEIGIVYRTTEWTNANDTYGYSVFIKTTDLIFAKGSNSSTGAYTALQTIALSLTAGQTYHLQIQVSGNAHTFYLNGTKYGPYTDTTYPSSGGGGVGLRCYSPSGAMSGYYANLGIWHGALGAISGTRVSPVYNLTNILAASSIMNWDVTIPSDCTFSVDVSLDGGTTWTLGVTSGSSIAGITAGTNLASVQLCWRYNFASTNAYYTPALYGMQLYITAVYQSGGARIHPALDLSPAGTAGSAPLVWETTLPANTAVRVDSTLTTPDPASSLSGWTTSGTVAVDTTRGNGDSESWHVSAASYMWKSMPITDGQVIDVDVWIDAAATTPVAGILFGCNSSGGGHMFIVSGQAPSTGSLSLGFASSSAWQTWGASNGAPNYSLTVPTGAWQHITLVFTAGTVLGYVNYQYAATLNLSGDGTYFGLSCLTNMGAWFDNLQVWSTQAVTAENIPGISYADGAVLDTFQADTSADYISTADTLGSTAVWTWDLTNSRLEVSGGDHAILEFAQSIQSSDVTLTVDMTQSDAGGLVARMSDTGDFYFVLLSDNSSSSGTATVELWKEVSGSRTKIAESGEVSWVRGTMHRVFWTVQGNAHTVMFDGATLLSVIDSSITAGTYVGLINVPAGSGSSAFFYDFNIQPLGESLAGVSATVREHLTSSDPQQTPELLDITLSCRSWYIQDGPLILSAVYSYPTIADAINDLATKAGFFWMIDINKQLWFMPRTAVLAPWIADGTTMFLETIEIDHAAPLYRNRQYIRGVTDVTDPQTETRLGDGHTKAFTFGYPLDAVPAITVAGVTQTVGVKGVDTGDQWYWAQGSPTVTQDTGATPLADGVMFSITYVGQFDIIVISEDDGLIAEELALEGSGTGWEEQVTDEPNDTSATMAQQSASLLLSTYGVSGLTIKFVTKKAGIIPGQLLMINLPEHDINYESFLVEQADPYEGPGGVTYWTVSAIEGPVTGDWVAAFQRLTAQAPVVINQVNLGTNQVLATTLTPSESTPWAESVATNVETGVAPSTTLYPSTTFYPI